MPVVISRTVHATNEQSAKRAAKDLEYLGALAVGVVTPKPGLAWKAIAVFPDKPGPLPKGLRRVKISSQAAYQLGLLTREPDVYVDHTRTTN